MLHGNALCPAGLCGEIADSPHGGVTARGGVSAAAIVRAFDSCTRARNGNLLAASTYVPAVYAVTSNSAGSTPSFGVRHDSPCKRMPG
jgi:hypothetical protein